MTTKEYTDLIDRAAKVSGDDNNFIVGCRDFLKRAGFLTPKQVECLKHPLPPLAYQFSRGGYESLPNPDCYTCDFCHCDFCHCDECCACPGNPDDYGHN